MRSVVIHWKSYNKTLAEHFSIEEAFKLRPFHLQFFGISFDEHVSRDLHSFPEDSIYFDIFFMRPDLCLCFRMFSNVSILFRILQDISRCFNSSFHLLAFLCISQDVLILPNISEDIRRILDISWFFLKFLDIFPYISIFDHISWCFTIFHSRSVFSIRFNIFECLSRWFNLLQSISICFSDIVPETWDDDKNLLFSLRINFFRGDTDRVHGKVEQNRIILAQFSINSEPLRKSAIRYGFHLSKSCA
jgi:hypothetical protein